MHALIATIRPVPYLVRKLAPPLGALALVLAAPLHAHSAHVIDDFRALSVDRPRACPAGAAPPPPAPAGWRADQVRCAWRGLLQVQRWHAPARAPAVCVGGAAQYWAWMRTRFGQPMRDQSRAWDMTWRANAVRASGADAEHVSVITRNADNSWTATEWRWTPSSRRATRAWQQGRWQLLQQAAAAMQPAAPARPAPEVSMVQAAWEDALKGRPAETGGALWRWQGSGACLAIDIVGLSDAQVQMPYQESEGRLEQRAAMQLLMARRYPGSDWLDSFALLPRERTVAGGAKYTALWRQGDHVRGQLWIPRKDEQSIVRVRMSTALPAGLTEAQRAPHVQRTSRAIYSEITALAAAWDARYER